MAGRAVGVSAVWLGKGNEIPTVRLSRPGLPENGPGSGTMSVAGRTAAGERNPSRKVRTPQGRTVDNSHSGKPAGKCHRNTRPMARPHVSRAQAKVKGCGKSAPAPW